MVRDSTFLPGTVLIFLKVYFYGLETIIAYQLCCCLTVKSCPTLLWPYGLASRQAPLAMRFPRQEYRSRLPGHPPGDFPHPGIEPQSPALGSGFFTAKPATRETQKPIVLQLKIGKCNELTCKVKNNSKVVAFFKLVYQVLTLQATHPLSFLVWRGRG